MRTCSRAHWLPPPGATHAGSLLTPSLHRDACFLWSELRQLVPGKLSELFIIHLPSSLESHVLPQQEDQGGNHEDLGHHSVCLRFLGGSAPRPASPSSSGSAGLRGTTPSARSPSLRCGLESASGGSPGGGFGSPHLFPFPAVCSLCLQGAMSTFSLPAAPVIPPRLPGIFFFLIFKTYFIGH